MENTVKALLAEIKEIPELAKNLSNDVDIMNEVGLDSLQTVTFLFKLEEAGEDINNEKEEPLYISYEIIAGSRYKISI